MTRIIPYYTGIVPCDVNIELFCEQNTIFDWTDLYIFFKENI